MKRLVLGVLLIIFLSSFAYGLSRAIENQVVSVGNTATKLPTTPLVGRRYILLQNVGSQTVYLGKSDVTADTTGATGGLQLLPYAMWLGEYNHNVDIYGIVTAGTCDVVVEEGK